MSCTDWADNGEMIRDVVELGYIVPDSDTVLDVTYGLGNWWTCVRPSQLLTHDLALDGVDFRHLPEPDSSVDVVVFDLAVRPPGRYQPRRDSRIPCPVRPQRRTDQPARAHAAHPRRAHRSPPRRHARAASCSSSASPSKAAEPSTTCPPSSSCAPSSWD